MFASKIPTISMNGGFAKKLILIGFDGGNPPFIERFTREGRLPNISNLTREGVYSESLPVMPCDTPTNWCTIVTGAWPGTHGITSFHIHLPGELLNKVHFSVRSYWSKAEFLWDAAARAGKKTAAIMWPLSFPPTCKSGIFIDGTGPGDPQWRLDHSAVYTTRPIGESRGHRADVPVRLIEAEGWKNLPASSSKLLETTIEVSSRTALVWTEGGWESLEKRSLANCEGASVRHHLLIIDSKDLGYDKVIIAREKDAEKPLAVLKPFQWSGWIYENLEKRPLSEAEERFDFRELPRGIFRGYFKYKLIALSTDARVFTLYRTDIFMDSQWAYPESVTQELIQNVGPFIEGLELTTPTLAHGDWETYFESIDMQVDWQIKAARYLKEKYDPDLLLVQIHTQDAINHQLSRVIDEANPEYNPVEANKAWQRFARTYEDVDRLVGGIIEGCADEETLIVLLSDHGAIPVYKLAWVGVALMRKGLLTYKKDTGTGKTVVDWSRTKAYPWRTYIHVNLKGRDPNGIVEPRDYERVREEILQAIYSMRDPETGECPIALAVRKEDARILGQWGERVGDIIYYLKPGYTDVDLDRDRALKLSVEELRNLRDVEPSMEICAHHQFLPTATYGGMTVKAVFIMSGPRVKKGYRRRTPIWQVDVAPTIAYALGIPKPAQCDGKVVYDFFEP
ncbi:MAG: alkaline phosphatase family protein [Candidatus Bathyarchaeia archaeon]